jgi:hypothetical protein
VRREKQVVTVNGILPDARYYWQVSTEIQVAYLGDSTMRIADGETLKQNASFCIARLCLTTTHHHAARIELQVV